MSNYQLPDAIKEPSNLVGKCLTPFQRKLLQKSLQENGSESYRQRLEIMLMADAGKTQTEICRTLGCCPATARHWMHIARMGMAHQWQDCPIGRPKTVNEEYLERLKELINNSPRDYGYSFRRWTANALQKHLAKELGITVSDRHLKRLLKQMGLSTRNKPSTEAENLQHPQDRKILISDLKTTNSSDNLELLSLHLAKLGTNLEIHGTQSL